MSLNLVFSDLVKLADGLRSKGLTKQADGLEDKIYQLKQAETHLYKAFEEDGQDLLDFAHPDGSPTVSPAQNQMGQVETLDEAQRKVLEIINKKPTGKFSSEIRDLILITAEALDLSLIKSGQEKPNEVDILGDPAPTEELGEGEISEENAKVELALGHEKLQKREEINKEIDKKKQILIEALNVALAKLDANYTTNPAMLLSGRGANFFIEKTKTPVENLNILKQASNTFKDYTPESIAENIFGNKKIPEFLENFKKYETGTNITWDFGANILNSDSDIKKAISEKAATDSRYTFNPESIWKARYAPPAPLGLGITNIINPTGSFSNPVLDPAKVNEISKIISEYLIQINKSTFSKDNFEIFQKAIKTDEKLVTLKDLLTTSIDHVAGIPSVRLSSGAVFEKLKIIITDLNKSYEFAQKVTVFQEAIPWFNPITLVMDNLIEARGKIESLKKFLAENPLQENEKGVITDRLTTKETISSIISTLMSIASLLKDKTEPDVVNLYNLTARTYSALKDAVGVPWSSVYGKIAKDFPDANTPEILLTQVQQGLEWAQSLKKKANLEFNKIVTAQNPFPSDMKKTPPTGGNKSPTGPTKSYDPKDSVQTAVAEMQLVLNNFGRLISKTNPADGLQIIGTGPKNEATSKSFDGIWGPNTANSLEKANTYVGGRLNESIKWIAANKNHVAGTEQIAKNNTAILNSAIIGMGGQSSVTQTGEILDEISKNINWSDPTSGDPAGPGWGDSAKEFLGVKKSGTIPIYKNNLYSFSSLYRFVTANNLKQIETASVDKSIGFSYKTWHEILNWFVNRAKYNFSQAGQDENKLKLAQTYYYASKRLLDIINKFPQNEEFIAPTSKLDSLLGGNSNIEKYKKNKQYQEDKSQNFTSEDMDGTRAQIGEGQSESDSSPYQTLPYDNNTINFNHQLWEQTGIRDKFGLPLLKLRIYDLKGAPSQVANNLFGGSVLSPRAREEAEAKRLSLKGIWREDVGLVDANGDQIFNDYQKNKLMFKYSPDNTYRLFLGELRKALYDVTRDFAENAAKESSDRLSEPYKTWNNTISNQENRITNQR